MSYGRMTLLLFCLISVINNEKGIRMRLRSAPRRNIVSKSIEEDEVADAKFEDNFSQECFIARTDTVPTSLYGTLPRPYINLGFAKMGTSSIHSFFGCGGYRSLHYRCGKSFSCAKCMQESADDGLPPLSKCMDADVYAQIDDGSGGHYPQVELLDEIVRGHPNATFFLTFRSMEKWYHSLSHWPPKAGRRSTMMYRLLNSNISGFPATDSSKDINQEHIEEFSNWFCRHVQRVRNIVAQNPSHALVEIDIEDPGTAERMADIFNVDKSCWVRANANSHLHPELNQSKVKNPWCLERKKPINYNGVGENGDGAGQNGKRRCITK